MRLLQPLGHLSRWPITLTGQRIIFNICKELRLGGSSSDSPFVSRGGLKLQAALEHFAFDVDALACADLGSHVGGFVDCMLQRGAARVYSVDTAYGTLAWILRKDDRVVVMERTNALHVELPEAVDLVTIDVGWTRQNRILPVARRLLKPDGAIITLIKPHYEADKVVLQRGVLPTELFDGVVAGVLGETANMGLELRGTVTSPIMGHGGNREVLALLKIGS